MSTSTGGPNAGPCTRTPTQPGGERPWGLTDRFHTPPACPPCNGPGIRPTWRTDQRLSDRVSVSPEPAPPGSCGTLAGSARIVVVKAFSHWLSSLCNIRLLRTLCENSIWGHAVCAITRLQGGAQFRHASQCAVVFEQRARATPPDRARTPSTRLPPALSPCKVAPLSCGHTLCLPTVNPTTHSAS